MTMNALIRMITLPFKVIFHSIRLIVKVFNYLLRSILNIDALIAWLEQPSKILLSIGIVFYIILDIVGEIPSALHVNLVILSAIFGGLVLTGALFKRSPEDTQHRLLGIAKLFILSTALLLLFYIFYGLVELLHVDPWSIEFSVMGALRAVFFWIIVAGIFGGTYIFSYALIDLIILLRQIGRPDEDDDE